MPKRPQSLRAEVIALLTEVFSVNELHDWMMSNPRLQTLAKSLPDTEGSAISIERMAGLFVDAVHRRGWLDESLLSDLAKARPKKKRVINTLKGRLKDERRSGRDDVDGSLQQSLERYRKSAIEHILESATPDGSGEDAPPTQRNIEYFYVPRTLTRSNHAAQQLQGETFRGALAELLPVYGEKMQRLLITGDVGSGKSTVIRHYALELLRSLDSVRLGRGLLPIPILLQAEALLQNIKKTKAEAHLFMGERQPMDVLLGVGPEFAALMSALAGHARLLLLIDDLDHAPDPKGTWKGLKEAIHAPPFDLIHVILAKRHADGAGPSWSHAALNELNREGAISLLERRGLDSEGATRLVRALEAPPPARTIMGHPASLCVLARLTSAGGEPRPPPRTRGKTCEYLLWELLKKEAHASIGGATSRSENDELIRRMSWVALQMLSKDLASEEEVAAHLSQYLSLRGTSHGGSWRPITRVVDTLTRACAVGILRRHEHRLPPEYSFPLADVKTYLASCALREMIQNPSLFDVDGALASASKVPDRWEGCFGMAAEEPATSRAVMQRAVDLKSPQIISVVARYASGFDPQVTQDALQALQGAQHWEKRRDLLLSLAARSTPSITLGVLEVFLPTTRDGNDLYWIRETARRAFDGMKAAELAGRAQRLVMGIFQYIPPRARVEAEVELSFGWAEVPSGEFQMGAVDLLSQLRARIPHRVVVDGPFKVLRRLVTRRAYQCFDPDYRAHGCEEPRAGPDVPATDLTWYAAAMFAEWLEARLPLDAEWEYIRSAADPPPRLHHNEAMRQRLVLSVPSLGTSEDAREPGGFGVRELGQRYREWCRDEYVDTTTKLTNGAHAVVSSRAATYAINGEVVSGGGPSREDQEVVVRGGSLADPDRVLPITTHVASCLPSYSNPQLGFRLVRAT